MTPDGWRVLDVYLDETVSLLALHRAEFTSVLRSKGFEGFIAAMNAKSDELTPG
jgi:phospholipid transport system substrate-binding protein